MGIKSWFKEHKKLVKGIGIGAVVGVGFGVACRLIFKEDASVDPVTLDSKVFEKIINAFEDKAMDATFDTLKDKIVDSDKYANLDEYLNAIQRTIWAPGGKVNVLTGEVIFD